jgi:hypothetical protein
MVFSQDSARQVITFEDYIRNNVATNEEVDVFLNKTSWAQFDSDIGYILGNYIPKDGLDESSTLSTVQQNGARTSFMYPDVKARINTYGNSFTQCHQVSDGETWQEYLAAHLGEPIRNFGMGGLGVYQAYKRMLREEQTENSAEYVLFYIWGDDHLRSLLRCRYMLIKDWIKENNEHEGIGKMFHGNFWSNIEMDLATGQLIENKSRISEPENLTKMCDADWMYDNLKDDLALQMALYLRGKITELDLDKLKILAGHLGEELTTHDAMSTRISVSNLLNQYTFEATKYILDQSREFVAENNKKLMVILFDPYSVTKELIMSGTRYDQEIVDHLEENGFNYFDMNLVHVEDFKSFNLTLTDYFNRYFIGHYNPLGNHFFAFSLKPKIVDWLNPKPITYQDDNKKHTSFKGYLEGY